MPDSTIPVDPITLVAMAPSGATLILRDYRGRLWLYPPEGAGVPRLIDSELAERAIAQHDLDRIDRNFASWAELDAFRQERAQRNTPRTVVDVESLDAHDIKLLLDVAERWLADGEGHQARQLALKLLDLPAVRADQATHRQLVGFLERYEVPQLLLRSKPHTRLQAAARVRWELPRAA